MYLFARVYIFANCLKCTLEKVSQVFIFVVPEGQINFSICDILCSCTRQYECDDVLDGFWGQGDGCRSDTGSETVPVQIFAGWDSFANIANVCTPRKYVHIIKWTLNCGVEFVFLPPLCFL